MYVSPLELLNAARHGVSIRGESRRGNDRNSPSFATSTKRRERIDKNRQRRCGSSLGFELGRVA